MKKTCVILIIDAEFDEDTNEAFQPGFWRNPGQQEGLLVFPDIETAQWYCDNYAEGFKPTVFDADLVIGLVKTYEMKGQQIHGLYMTTRESDGEIQHEYRPFTKGQWPPGPGKN